LVQLLDNKVRVEKGSTLADETKKKMAQSISQIKQILEGTQKIVSASKEQSQGVSQISTSVDALNQTIQDTASTAQESASASQELASQADSLMGLVDELRFLVAGSRQESLENPSPMESMTQAKVISIEKAQKKTPLVRSAPNQGPSVKTGTSNDPWETL
jgi:methyl-accepting chemotaxis protein